MIEIVLLLYIIKLLQCPWTKISRSRFKMVITSEHSCGQGGTINKIIVGSISMKVFHDLWNLWWPMAKNPLVGLMWHPCVSGVLKSFAVSFVLIGPTLQELRLFETLTLKIWSQGHVGGRRSWPTFMALCPKNCLALVSSQSGWRFWRYSHLKLWPWKPGAQVTPGVKGHDLYLWTSTQQFICRWFRLNRNDGSGITTVWNVDLEHSKSRSHRRSTVMTYIYGPLPNNFWL